MDGSKEPTQPPSTMSDESSNVLSCVCLLNQYGDKRNGDEHNLGRKDLLFAIRAFLSANMQDLATHLRIDGGCLRKLLPRTRRVKDMSQWELTAYFWSLISPEVDLWESFIDAFNVDLLAKHLNEDGKDVPFHELMVRWMEEFNELGLIMGLKVLKEHIAKNPAPYLIAHAICSYNVTSLSCLPLKTDIVRLSSPDRLVDMKNMVLELTGISKWTLTNWNRLFNSLRRATLDQKFKFDMNCIYGAMKEFLENNRNVLTQEQKVQFATDVFQLCNNIPSPLIRCLWHVCARGYPNLIPLFDKVIYHLLRYRYFVETASRRELAHVVVQTSEILPSVTYDGEFLIELALKRLKDLDSDWYRDWYCIHKKKIARIQNFVPIDWWW